MTNGMRTIKNKECSQMRRELEELFCEAHRAMCDFLGQPCTVFYGEWGFLFADKTHRQLCAALKKARALKALRITID